MPILPTEHDFKAVNSPPSVQDTGTHEKRVIKNPCPNHENRPRTKRMGQVAKYCALCMDQQEMAARWKNIWKALATIRCFTRKSSPAAEPASTSVEAHWEVSIVRTASPATAAEGMQVLVAIDCSQGRLTVLESAA